MAVPNRRRDLPIRVRGRDSGRLRESGRTRSYRVVQQTRGQFSLIMVYNLEANGKVDHGHNSIVKVIVPACNGRVGNWPRLLPFAFWANQTTHGSVTGYMTVELMLLRSLPAM